jgi:hypothetical protein
MSATGTQQSKVAQARHSAVHSTHATEAQPSGLDDSPRHTGYGLPCCNCGTYYSADQPVCPICKCSERVSPHACSAPAVAQPPMPSSEFDELDEERERFLKEFKAQLFSAHMQINATQSFRCSLDEKHREEFEPAAICKSCYERAQTRADQMEAALHMDAKEAAQIVYDAVWADPADPSKTYLNAAQALLTELRRRAGINMLLTTLQPYQH